MAERTQRLDFRLTASNRKLIERAALLLGQPLTAFAVRVLVEQAEQVIAQDSERKLSARDWKRFLEILDDDTVTPALARAAKRYRERTKRP
ncbi:MAG: DUF1778 domain-containing protein [Myxococcales bacterium]|nr:DUF1778 domain-containing protein [Myxococcales bacterium]MDP3498807.1 DUF1778 domain-containing protein [Myxococcales bacterium]